MGQQQTDRAYPLESDTALRPANVDMEEVRYYAALANTWWDPNGPFWPLHSLNTLRMGYLRSVLAKAFSRNEHEPKPLSGIRVLDVGCGDGLFLNVLASYGRITNGVGFDVSSTAIASARSASKKSAASQYLKFLDWEVGQDWPEGQFDVVSMIDVLHHIPTPNKQSAIESAAKKVRPGGQFLFKDIGMRPRWRAFFNTVHDLVLTGERPSYTPLNEVVSWVEAAGLREQTRRTINRIWYGHELVVFTK